MTKMNQYLDVAPEVEQALADGKPVVALESTIISHGMPYPKNVETALLVEKTIRENGAVPATIAIIGGRLKAGLSHDEIEHLGKAGRNVAKASRRDLPVLVARKADGATTVTTTMIIAHMAGIKIFATGGIGGVHRGAEVTMDISADLEELAQTPVMVVCAGAKSILDLGLTLEYLETKGVPVIGFGTEELPAFYTRKSGFSVDYRVDTPEELAAIFKAQRDLDYKGGMLVTNPIPEEFAMDKAVIDAAIEKALAEAKEQGIHGKETTPFLLAKVVELTGGDSLESNIKLYENFRVLFRVVVNVFYYGVLLTFLLIVLCMRPQRIVLLYLFVSKHFPNSFVSIYNSEEFMSLFLICIKAGYSTRESLHILKAMKNKPLISFLAFHMDESLMEGETMKEAAGKDYYDSALSRFIKIATHANDFSKIIESYISLAKEKIARRMKGYTLAIQLITYAFIGAVIIFIYQILFMPMRAISIF